MNVLLALLWSMLKIGCFAFGGGYAIIALLEGEFITKRKWIEHDEFMDVVAIAESTPGPIAINVATYVGYKLKGFLGATIATIGICAPSFVIMYVVSLFYEQFMEITVIAAAFKGIQICVVYLIATAGLKMLKKMKKTPLNIIVYATTCVAMIVCSLLDTANFRPISKSTAKMIDSQSIGNTTPYLDESDLYAHDVQLIAKNGKIYYLPTSTVDQ